MRLNKKIFQKFLLFCGWMVLLMIVIIYYYYIYTKVNSRIFSSQLDGLKAFWVTQNFSTENEKLFLDITKEPNEDALILALEQELPNVPFDYWNRHGDRPMEINETCAQFTAPLQIQYYNIFWQSYENLQVQFRLFGAYFDNREGNTIRVLGAVNQIDQPFPISYCQLWYENRTAPSIVEISQYNLIWFHQWYNESNHWYSHLMSCELPSSEVPKTVSLVSTQCEKATNNLKIIYDRKDGKSDEIKESKKIAVCIKGLNFLYADISVRLVEWFELHKLLGAEKIFIYVYAVHENVQKVLNYYQSTGYVELRPLSLAADAPHLPLIENIMLQKISVNVQLTEVIAYNDCFYRNLYKFDYIAIVDLDEVIAPIANHTTWHELIDEAHKNQLPHQRSANATVSKNWSAICFPHVLFPSNKEDLNSTAPDYMHLLRHVSRTDLVYPDFIKCLHSTAEVLTLHNHFPVELIHGNCTDYCIISLSGHLQHYREQKKILTNTRYLIRDENLWRYAEPWTENTVKTLLELKLLS